MEKSGCREPFVKPDTPIFLLHGLGASNKTMWPLEQYLRIAGGYTTVFRPNVACDHMRGDEYAAAVAEYIHTKLQRKDQPIALIGQSMGGYICNVLPKHGFNIARVIYIVTPIHGARLLDQLEAVLPSFVRNALYKPPYVDLQPCTKADEPKHPYHSISVSLPFAPHFDGSVYRDEAMFDKKHHTHMPRHHHGLVIANPLLWRLCCKALETDDLDAVQAQVNAVWLFWFIVMVVVMAYIIFSVVAPWVL